MEQKYKKTCFKKRYSSKKEAKEFLVKINRELKEKKLKEIYFCEQCSAWHHTSMDKVIAREFRRAQSGQITWEEFDAIRKKPE